MEVVPLFLQGSQVRLQLSLDLLVPHGEELAADVQGVDEAGLIPLEQQLRVLRSEREGGRTGGGVFKEEQLFVLLSSPTINSNLISSFHYRLKGIRMETLFLVSFVYLR